jgi:BarA-like signal transduction histidine kinase
VLANYGLTLAVVDVETENSITTEQAEKWKAVAEKNKLFLIIPKNAKVKATELLWQKGIGDKVSVGTYEIVINMP